MKNSQKRIPGLLLAAVLLLAGSRVADAAFDETSAVHIDAASVENATLAIGTHLIHLSAVTDEMYQAAVESAGESGQESIYYKSELGDGAWYDITQASGIRTITKQGKPVEDSVINALFFRYHTKSDGITYDLAQGGTVSPFDLNNPYDLMKLPELEPLCQQFERLSDKKARTESDEYNFLILQTFYRTEVRNTVTAECDKELEALQRYYEQLADSREEADKRNEVMDVMGTVDAGRRAEVMAVLKDQALVKLMDWMSGSGWEEEGMPDELTVNADAVEAAGTSLANVEQSLIEAQGNRMQEGTTIFDRQKFLYSSQLLMEAKKDNVTGCDTAVTKLLRLSNIENGSIVDAQGELALLDEELLSTAEVAYQSALAGGVSGQYRAGISNRSSDALLTQLLMTQKSDANVHRLELERMLQARADRMGPEAAKEYITQRIGRIGDFRDIIAQDAFQSYAAQTVEEHLDWLRGLLTTLTAQTGGSLLDELAAQKEKLQEERLSCLDGNDLAGAKKLQTQILAKAEEMTAEENRLHAILNAQTSSEAQKALAQSALGNGTAAATAAVQNVKNAAVADIRSGDVSGVKDSLESIAQLYEQNAAAAAAALKELYQALITLQLGESAGAEGSKEIQDCLDRTAALLAEHTAVPTGTLSEEGFYALLAELLGSDFAQLGARDKAAALIAVNWYADETKNSMHIRLAGSMAEELYAQKLPYLYRRPAGRTGEYAPADALANCIGYRYIFEDTGKEATLQKGLTFYRFRAADRQVLRETALTEEMAHSAWYEEKLYLEESYLYDRFKCRVEYILETDYGVIATEPMISQAEELLEAMRQGGET